MVSLLALSTVFAALAGYVDVKKGGKVIGGLQYSYRLQSSSTGCFVTVNITNQTDEFVRGRITGTGTSRSCGDSFRVKPHGNVEVVFGCSETPSDVILEYVSVEN